MTNVTLVVLDDFVHPCSYLYFNLLYSLVITCTDFNCLMVCIYVLSLSVSSFTYVQCIFYSVIVNVMISSGVQITMLGWY